MKLRRGVSLAVLLVLAVSVLAAITPATAAPPPRPLCDACGESFEDAAEAHGLTITVEQSTATVVVDESGSATWVVRNHLGDSASTTRLRGNESLRTEIADGAMRDVAFRDVAISPDGVMTLRYRDPDFAEPSVGGVLRSGAFTEAYGYRNLHGLGADRLTVEAPDGMRVGWTVPGASVSDDGTQFTLTTFERPGFLTFTPRGSRLGPVVRLLAVGALVGPAVALNAVVQFVLPAGALGLLVGASGRVLSRRDPPTERVADRVGIGLLAVGVLVTALALVAAGGVSLLGGVAAPVFGVGIAIAAIGLSLTRSAIRDAASYPALVVGAAVGVTVAAGATVGAAIAFGQNGLTRSLLTSLLPLVPLFALFPAGYALGRENSRVAVGTAVVGFALATLPLASGAVLAPRQWVSLVLVYAIADLVGALVLGSPLLVSGFILSRTRPRSDSGSSRRG
ncbi:hypothetical protein ACFQH6_06615 [Halobacteriaceae archaeon GCM10025711]